MVLSTVASISKAKTTALTVAADEGDWVGSEGIIFFDFRYSKTKDIFILYLFCIGDFVERYAVKQLGTYSHILRQTYKMRKYVEIWKDM